ncbi:Maf family protein [Aestuariibacter salexigens]|uniref:Maf family protein n=1 Tax=Aestuariibacter salexigens TaxID=226010 RepID=UPI0003F733AD|nr:Maf family protein [Aestuariibacter salexigens]
MLTLASTSPYKRQLLSKLGINFEAVAPQVNELAKPDENAMELAARLAYEKADAIAKSLNQGIVVGADQTAALQKDDGAVTILGKPETEQNAMTQLRACAGHTVRFYTALCVIDCDADRCLRHTEITDVTFKSLSDEQIAYYIRTERPLDCAGSFKAEGLGIALFSSIQGRDPNALIGLPLMALTDMLLECGVDVLHPHITDR